MEKENKKLKLLLVILSLFTVGLCAYTVYQIWDKGSTYKCTEEKESYSYASMEGIYKLSTEVEIDGGKEKAGATLYLWRDGTFKYEQSVLAPMGQLGNYIIEENKIKLNYLFETNSGAGVNVITGEKELTINSINSIEDVSIKWGTVKFSGTLQRQNEDVRKYYTGLYSIIDKTTDITNSNNH